MQPRLDGFGTQIEGRCRLLDAHLLDHAADEHGAEVLRQLVDGAFERPLDLSLGQGTLRIGFPAMRKGDDLRAWRIEQGARHRLEARPSSAPARERLVEDDAREPGSEARFVAKTAQGAESAKIGLLQGILRLAIVPQHAARDPVKPAIVAGHDRANGKFVSLTCPGDQAGFHQVLCHSLVLRIANRCLGHDDALPSAFSPWTPFR